MDIPSALPISTPLRLNKKARTKRAFQILSPEYQHTTYAADDFDAPLPDEVLGTSAFKGAWMRSISNLTIEWVKPDIATEQWEFSHHPAKQDFYLRHNIGWDQIMAGFDAGRLVAYPRSDRLDGVPVALSYSSYDDYARYLAKAKRGYRRNYSLMEESLQRHGTLTLPAPIILRCGGEALLFSGYRRLCLSWNYGMAPSVWLLSVSPDQAAILY